MKKLSLILMLLFTATAIISQNIIDSNTEIIEDYFRQQNNSTTKLVIKKNNINFETDVIIVQKGNQNNIDIDTSGKNQQTITQKGNNNEYDYYTYYNTIDTDLKITQNGNNNKIEIYGQNNLTKNMQIEQKTNNQTIIIKNYN